MELRDYQQAAVEAVYGHLRGRDDNPLVVIPTGGGKRPVIASICRDASVDCQVSLETPMACGIGICFSCVVKTEQPDGDWDYKRTCVDGPVFAAEKIVW